MRLTKIASMVKEQNITKFKYHTWRMIKEGGKEGEIRILVLDDGVARTEYACPKCGHIDYTEAPWKRPYSVKCSKCSANIGVGKLRDQAKREQKQRNAETE